MRDPEETARPDLMTDRAHSACVYNYLLGGKDNYDADRATGDATAEIWPGVRVTAHANRAFMHRAARFLAEQGVTQFLDIGTGIPTEPNLHQVVQAVEPSSRVVYVDNDPIVLAHTAALIALLHFVEDDDEAAAVVARLVDVLPSGSYLALSHSTDAFDPTLMAQVQARYRAGGVPVRFRGKEQVERLLAGVELVESGIVQAHVWRPDSIDIGRFDPRDIAGYAAIGLKA